MSLWRVTPRQQFQSPEANFSNELGLTTKLQSYDPNFDVDRAAASVPRPREKGSPRDGLKNVC